MSEGVAVAGLVSVSIRIARLMIVTRLIRIAGLVAIAGLVGVAAMMEVRGYDGKGRLVDADDAADQGKRNSEGTISVHSHVEDR
eukprot:CAMPEP_0170457210 /NCGR_PEP_ID=MMETSP0123-20130129/4580_1 /TAXON_ID=182087 /ORGANISM="Favella ehrenbergii, Strain Fehren 1" /LENGTH=83 /DNA_ID=CAMNT_0010720931 /DNA_START=401 /DNA_END=652 /DNA_ORIENTATION=+